ncbi:hybrid sensor histidine kinase/response regulator [Vibrio paucivorans]
MLSAIVSPMLYPKALILIATGLSVLVWLAYYWVSLKKANRHSLTSYQLPYLCYSICIMLWIFSNAYFHTDFLVTSGQNKAVFFAKFANLASYFAFAFAFYFSCRLLSNQRKKPVPLWQNSVFLVFSIFALYVNLSPDLAVKSVSVNSVSDFFIEFGEYTGLFFNSVLTLIFLTLFNLMRHKRHKTKLEQAKNNYMIAGILVFMISTAFIHVGMTYLFGDFSLTWLPPAFAISEMFFVGYAILTQRFYSPKYIVYISSTVVATGIIFSLPLSSLVFFLDSYNEVLIAGTLCILVGLSWAKVSYIVKRVIARVLYGSPYTPVEQILALERDFQHSTRNAIEKLAELLNIPQEKLQLVTNNYQDVAYANYLSSKKSILIVDEIANELSDSKSSIDERLSELHTKMHSSNTALVLPLYDHDSTVSHLLVSPHKKDGSLFSNEEISALQQVFSKVQSYINADRKVSQSQALANSIAHEMRNPLAQVQLQFEHLKLQVTSGDSLQSILGSIDKGSAAILRGRQLIDIILREVSDSSLQQEPASPNSISYALSTALGRYGFENEQVRQRVHFTDSDDFIANINDTLFSFVVFNLLRNAIYYFDSYPDSQIEITLQKGDHENCILFRDTGPGIEPTLRYKIFDDFFTHNKSGGSGLGLGYCQRVMEAFGGRIECVSELDEFTEFQLYFPVVSIGSTISPPIPSTGSPDRYALHSSFSEPAPVDSTTAVDVTKKTILIVDDKEVQRALVKIYLEQLDINVIQANNGETAVSVFRSNDVDLVLMDIQMPKMNGFEASELIKEISPATPIVALSGESSTYDLNRIDQLMDGRLEKPTTKQALESMITHLLAQKAQQQTVH